MAHPVATKEALRRLARGEQPETTHMDATAIHRAVTAIDDIDRAANFIEQVGLDRLEAAIQAARKAGNEELADHGTRALAAFRAFQHAAAGEPVHFRSGRATALGDAPKGVD